MNKDKVWNENYSERYVELMNIALENSRTFLFKNTPRISPQDYISNENLEIVKKFIFDEIYPYLSHRSPGYWGNSCQFLSSHLFAILSSIGIKAEIVIGEVNINGTLEFDTTLEGLKKEFYSQEDLCHDQCLHAWVSLGGDTIIDAGLPDRMVKNYRFPEKYMPPILVGRASEISKNYRAQHQPLLLGTEYFARTNPPDPMELLEVMKGDKRWFN